MHPHPVHGSLGPHESAPPKQDIDLLSRFCRAHQCAQETGKHRLRNVRHPYQVATSKTARSYGDVELPAKNYLRYAQIAATELK